MSPTITVVMPVYNAERYVEEAVESILAQTFADFELLIVDDGSTDGSRAILERLASRDPRIRLRSRPNTGYVVALNEMLGLARGEFVARMDADDVAMPGRFAWQLEFLRENPDVVVVGGGQDYIDSEGRLLHVHSDPVGDAEIQASLMEGCCAINHPSVMARREAMTLAGGYRVEMMPAEDLDLWLRLGESGRLANLPQVVTRYRMHEGSVSERHQIRQRDRMRAACHDACDRRGIERREISMHPWRPTDRASKHRYWVGYGWMGFNRGDRSMALHYGLWAVRLLPWKVDGWRLLACALLKKPAGRAT